MCPGELSIFHAGGDPQVLYGVPHLGIRRQLPQLRQSHIPCLRKPLGPESVGPPDIVQVDTFELRLRAVLILDHAVIATRRRY